MPIRGSPNGAGYTRPQPGRDRPEWVVAINRNAWSQSIGISGRNQPVRAVSTELPENIPISENELRALEILLGPELKELLAKSGGKPLK
jgi:hypothetical protein